MKKTFIALIACLSFSSAAMAGNATGTVQYVRLFGDLVVFGVGTHHGKPACSIHGDDWGFSLSSENGKEMYSMLLAAGAQGKTIGVMGTNSCDAPWADRETPAIISIEY